tara:strand:+ start:4982 stop:5278 length:297 start_codon:yes stop_codon:yes gene_type:complete
MSLITWNNADFEWDNNSYTWDEVELVKQLISAAGEEEWPQWNEQKKKRFIKLILKVYGDTITESKQKEIKQYKIKAKDIKIVVKEVLGTKVLAENISF